jgi:hypothetical protein
LLVIELRDVVSGDLQHWAVRHLFVQRNWYFLFTHSPAASRGEISPRLSAATATLEAVAVRRSRNGRFSIRSMADPAVRRTSGERLGN